MTKTKTITVATRLTQAEYDQLVRLAESQSVPVSVAAMLRHIVLERIK